MDINFDKTSIKPFASSSKGIQWLKVITKQNQILDCICGEKDSAVIQCYRCHQKVHKCITRKPNRGPEYQCASCVSKHMDPLNSVRKVFVQSYFQIENIFQHDNSISFQFNISNKSADLCFDIQVRGLRPGGTSLAWPKQGLVELNRADNIIHEFKPLKANSNRKARKQEYFTIDKRYLYPGKNYLRFKIPALKKQLYTKHFEYDERAVFYFSINKVQKLSTNELIRQTKQFRKIQKDCSLQLFRSEASDIQICKDRINLICPFTFERIKYPVRGKYCKHFTCICLKTLIQSHKEKRSWNCPICPEKITQPYLDKWIFSMLKSNKNGTEVVIDKDGNYSWVGNDKPIEIESDDSLEKQRIKPTKIEEIIKATKKLSNEEEQQDRSQIMSQVLPQIPPGIEEDDSYFPQYSDHRFSQIMNSLSESQSESNQEAAMQKTIEQRQQKRRKHQTRQTILEVASVLLKEHQEKRKELQLQEKTHPHYRKDEIKQKKKERELICDVPKLPVFITDEKFFINNYFKQDNKTKKICNFLQKHRSLQYAFKQVVNDIL